MSIPIIEDLSSPSGKMSKRARKAAEKRNYDKLWPNGFPKPQGPAQPTVKDDMLRRAVELRVLAERGMKPRAYRKEAERLETMAKDL